MSVIPGKFWVNLAALVVWTSSLRVAAFTNLADIPCGRAASGSRSARVVGGVDAVPREFPWIVSITRKGGHFCGGTIIDSRHILTAGHCLCSGSSKIPARQLRVSLGEYNLRGPENPPARQEGVARVLIHPGHKCGGYVDDIALLELTGPISWSDSVRPACLPWASGEAEYSAFEGETAIAAGWGWLGEDTSRHKRADILQKVGVRVVKNDVCREWYASQGKKTRVEPQQMCAGREEGGRDSCWVEHTVKFSLRVRRSGDSELLKILDEHVKQGNFVTLCFWISAALTISGYCGLPIIDVVAGTKTEPSRLIFRAWNPFPDIWPGYFLQLTMCYLTGVITASWSTLMAVLIIVPTCEMKVLGIELQGIIKTASLRERKDREIQESVKNWVKKHLGVIRYVEKLDRILNRLLLFDFVIYSGIFCTTFFQYIVLGLRYEIVVASSYMVAMAIQIMMIYWTGNEVIIHSESLVDAAYNGIWYRAPVWYTMTIKIIMQRCRKPLKLRVWKLYKVSTETCLTIAKTAYSYFAILRHIYFKK
ncbi:uncharacterized protein [Neodiprion pinetum]|uniref:uncharacterized protein n=1 Tax=Neodiprion pinetum TaxID=441929 RepID=UPI001EDF4098|nr:uncharacterized protein LOC124222750 [Neodiprion pinetum]